MKYCVIPGAQFNAHWKETEQAARHGLFWEDKEMSVLAEMFLCGYDLKSICETIKRPAAGVLSKLCNTGLLARTGEGKYLVSDNVKKFLSLKPTKEPIMANAPLLSTTSSTLIYGKDVATMSDNEIIDAIRRGEKELTELTSITTPSKKINARIDELKASLSSVAALLDDRRTTL